MSTKLIFRILKSFFLIFFLSLLITGCTTWKIGASGQKKISGKTYVIIGASSGMGRGVAEQLGKYKANVVLAARRTDLLEEVAAIIRKSGGNAVVVTTDISKQEDLQRVRNAALKEFSKIDVWINFTLLFFLHFMFLHPFIRTIINAPAFWNWFV